MTGSKGLTVCSLMPEEVEALLLKEYGDKLQPVDRAMLANRRQKEQEQQVRLEKYKSASLKPETPNSDDLNSRVQP